MPHPPTSSKTVLITGCSANGLGHALALEFHKRHYRVFATARDPAKMAALATLGIECLVLDVLSTQSIKHCIATVSEVTGGTLDILINNAGGGYMLPMADVELGECRKLYDLNVWSVVEVTLGFLPLLIKARGLVVVQSSCGSVVPSPGLGIYNSSKAAVGMIADNLRVELSPLDVRVVELKTGSVKSGFHGKGWKLPENSVYYPVRDKLEPFMNSETEEERKRMMEPERWARAVVDQLVKGRPPARVWKGGSASVVWAVWTFLWCTFMDGILVRMTGLDGLRALGSGSGGGSGGGVK